MIEITIPARRFWDEASETFITFKGTTLKLEHSLLSISKWESKWKKPFFDDKVSKTQEESIDYIRCMTLTQSVDPLAYSCIPDSELKRVITYMEDSMTATWFNNMEKKKAKSGMSTNGKKVTSELIYYWMTQLNIPFECEKWHINRLMTLIKIANIEGQPPKKMSPKEAASYRKALNDSRRAKYHTRG